MKPITHTGRLAVAGACIIGLLMASAPVGAQTTKEQLDDARQETTRIRSEFERIAQAFAEADLAQHRTEEQMERTAAEVARAKADIAELQDSLKDRIRTAYRMRGIGFFQFLLEARSFRDFNLRLMSLQRQTLADEDVLLQLRRKRAELQLKERQLAVENGVYERRRENYEKQAVNVRITLQQANSLVAQLKNRYTREQIAKLFSISRVTGGRIISLAHCPVDPPHVVTNSFGASRGGGSRRHQGNDIMADMGVPLRAVNDGTVTRVSNHGLGGLAFYLWDGSTEYYYAHLSKVAVSSGQRVSAGQLVGNNGDTGNAKGGAPHLHFEIHPGGGSAIDPYPSLSTVC
jgi:murein DD-endopeptidase MepM/ murein hydrolase activator NlpD